MIITVDNQKHNFGRSVSCGFVWLKAVISHDMVFILNIITHNITTVVIVYKAAQLIFRYCHDVFRMLSCLVYVFVDDKTRVVLETNDGKTDYINANHVMVSEIFLS